MTPTRVQLSRRKGYRMPEGAVKVDRSTRWGNPIRLQDWQGAFLAVLGFGELGNAAGMRAAAVKAYELLLTADGAPVDEAKLTPWQREVMTLRPRFPVPSIAEIQSELRGKVLACWCPLDGPCHADVLLKVANESVRAQEASR